MRWPWRKERENRGTVTFLPDGCVVIGAPHGSTEEQKFRQYEVLQRWMEEPLPRPPIMFAFPVDVDDQR